jgi:D-galactarolactone cycloisomerase
VKIERIAIYELQAPVKQPFGYSRAWMTQRAASLVEVTTDDGVTGWGEAFGPAHMSAAALAMLRPMLLGRDPFATEAIWNELYGRYREHGRIGPFMDAMSAIDIALWDIKGKALSLPVHRLLGGPIRLEVPVYASGLFRQRDGNAARYLADEARGYVKDGYRALKMKVGYGVEQDMIGVKAVREAVGPDVVLMVDANEAYDASTAIKLGRLMAPYDIGWFEEPVPPEDLDGYCEVKRGQPIPVAGGEADFTRYGFRDILARRAMDILQPDICAAGGFSECKKIADMASAHNIRVNPHAWGTPIAIAATLHLLAVLPDTPPALAAVPPMLELDLTEHGIRDAMMPDMLRPKNGRIAVPQGPGLGIEIDRDLITRFLVP